MLFSTSDKVSQAKTLAKRLIKTCSTRIFDTCVKGVLVFSFFFFQFHPADQFSVEASFEFLQFDPSSDQVADETFYIHSCSTFRISNNL